MKKYTADELFSMDTEKLRDLKCKLWDVREVLRTQDDNSPIMFSAYDIRYISNAAAILGAAYIGYRAVKYYTDKKFPDQEVNN